MAKTNKTQKIKYNPFSADSILAAFLVFLLLSQKVKGGIDAEFEMTLDMDDKDVVKDSMGIFKKNMEKANADNRFIEYGFNSVFRTKNVPLLVWYVTENEWKSEESKKVRAAIVGGFQSLHDKQTRTYLQYYLEKENAAKIENLRIKGESIDNLGFIQVTKDNPDIAKAFLDFWVKNIKEAKPKEEGAPAPETK